MYKQVLILATGYRVQDFFMPLKLYGVNSEDILETWKTFGPSHYLGIVSNSLPKDPIQHMDIIALYLVLSVKHIG